MLSMLIGLTAAATQLPAQKYNKERAAIGQPSLASQQLTDDTWRLIQGLELGTTKPAGCTAEPELGARVIAQSPHDANPSQHPWVEHWTVKRCETEVVYIVTFGPQKGGGTQLIVTPPKPKGS
jgi:hypothetical protein